MIFNFDEETIFNTINAAMENMSEEQAQKVIEQIDNAMPGLLELMILDAESAWKSEAENAGGWGNKYAQAIKTKFSGHEGEVYLDESSVDKSSGKSNFMYAMMMEKGVKSWSIKEALLASSKAKTGKDGIKFISIPMPVATPRKKGQGKMSSQFGGREMTSEMHKLVRSGGKVSGSIGVSTTAGTKQVNISGLTAFTTKQFHSGYGIFRTVSSRSRGWIYPDIPAEPVFNSVVEYVNKRVGEMVDDFCKAILKDNS